MTTTTDSSPSRDRLHRLVALRAERRSQSDTQRSLPSAFTSTKGSMVSRADQPVRAGTAMAGLARGSPSLPPVQSATPSGAPPAGEDLWATMARQAAKDAQVAELRGRLAHAKKMDSQRKVLDEQVSVRRDRKLDRSLQLREEQAANERDAELWAEERKAEQLRKRELATRIRQDCEEQALSRDERRRREEAERKAQEAALLNRIGEEINMVKQRDIENRERDKVFKAELAAVNEEQKRRKAQRAEEDAQQEIDFRRGYEERLDRQDNARRAAWRKVQERMRGRETIAMNRQATLDERAREDEARAMRDAASRNAQDAARQQERERKQKSELAAIKLSQEEQIRRRKLEQERQRQEEREAEQAELRRIEEEESQLKAAAAAKLRLQQQEQRQFLGEQIRMRHTLQGGDMISETERKLNKELIARTQAPPDELPPSVGRTSPFW